MSTYMSSKNENLDPLPSNEDNNDSDYRNGRRSRASREQVAILEESFKSNNQPSAKARELLAKKLNMPERTVQIWFQNRRAKIKLGQRKHHLALKEEALRQHCLAAYSGRPSVLPPQLVRPGLTPDLQAVSAFPNASSPMVNNANFSPYPASSPFFTNQPTFNGNYSSNFSTPVVNTIPVFEDNNQFNNSNNTNETSNTLNKNNNIFQCSILTIGTWRRMPLGNDELVCSYSIETNQMAWVIGDKMAKFRICFPFSCIKNMTLAFIDAIYAELSIEINGPPSFSTLNKDKVWSPCGDFTENHQASVNHKHVITGDAQSLRVQLLKLLELSSRLQNITEIKQTGPSNNNNNNNNNSTNNPGNLAHNITSNNHPYQTPTQEKVIQFPSNTMSTMSTMDSFNQHTPNPNPFAYSTFEEKPINNLNYLQSLHQAQQLALSAHATPILDQNACFSPHTHTTPHFDMNNFQYNEFDPNNLNPFNTNQHQQLNGTNSIHPNFEYNNFNHPFAMSGNNNNNNNENNINSNEQFGQQNEEKEMDADKNNNNINQLINQQLSSPK